MSLSYLQTSLDRIDAAARDDVIEICINPDGTCWGEFQGDHFMRKLDQKLTATEVKDLGNQIASSANTTMSKDRPIVSVSITYKGRPIRAQVITPPAVLSAMSISLRFFSSLPLEGIALDFLFGKERKLEELRLEKTHELRAVVDSMRSLEGINWWFSSESAAIAKLDKAIAHYRRELSKVCEKPNKPVRHLWWCGGFS